MCSEPPSRSRGLAQDIDEGNRDGPLTFDEAIAFTEGLKLASMDRPVIVDKEAGDCQLGDLLPDRRLLGRRTAHDPPKRPISIDF